MLVWRRPMPGHAAGTQTQALAGDEGSGQRDFGVAVVVGAAPGLVASWPAEAITQQVAPDLPGFAVEVLPEIDSTNSELMRRIRAGWRQPLLLVAERQTAGRGRLGRQWFSGDAGAAPGTVPGASANPVLASLTFSLALALAPRDWSGLSLAVGLSVARSLHPALQLKWPNDVWLQDRKLAGILIETGSVAEHRYAVVGIGINIAPRDGTQLATAPACLQELLPALDAPALLLRLVPALVQTLQCFEGQGFAPFQAAFQARDALRGRDIVLSDGSTGTAAGVDATGALLVHTSAGMKVITSAEVSVRPSRPLAGAAAAGIPGTPGMGS